MKKLGLFFLSLALAVGSPVSASTLECEKYAEFLKSYGVGSFALIDIDSNGVYELLTKIGDSNITLYTYRSDMSLILSTNKDFKVYKNTGAFSVSLLNKTTVSDSYYSMNNGKIELLAKKEGSTKVNLVTNVKKPENRRTSYLPYLYVVEDEKVSFSEYSSYIKDIETSYGVAKLAWHKNTAKNRRRYLK